MASTITQTVTAAHDAEVRRRVEAIGNRVNFLVFRNLVDGDHDAFDGLCACCWRARGDLYVLVSGLNRFDATQLFIWDEVRRLLREYRRLGREEIQRRALAGEFRHAARIIRNRIRDHIRKTYRQFRAEREPEPEPTLQEMKLVAAHLKDRLKTFRDALGWRNYATLWIVVHAWPFGRTRRERKGKIVAAIAERRKVSLQQARADKRALLCAVEDSSNPNVIALGLEGVVSVGIWFGVSGNEPRNRLYKWQFWQAICAGAGISEPVNLQDASSPGVIPHSF